MSDSATPSEEYPDVSHFGRYAISEAAKRGYAEQIEEALAQNKETVNIKDDSGNTPLHWYN